MTLSEAISQRQASRTARIRRGQQTAAELRVDEIGSVTDIERDYHAVDRAGDLAIESKFSELYQLVDGEAEKAAVARAFQVWQQSEKQEDFAVTGAVDEAATVLRNNNDFWLADGCGPDGRAA